MSGKKIVIPSLGLELRAYPGKAVASRKAIMTSNGLVTLGAMGTLYASIGYTGRWSRGVMTLKDDSRKALAYAHAAHTLGCISNEQLALFEKAHRAALDARELAVAAREIKDAAQRLGLDFTKAQEKKISKASGEVQ